MFKIDWAEFAEYCYKSGRGVRWNFEGWLGEMLFREGREWRRRFHSAKKLLLEGKRTTFLDLMCGGAYPSRNLARGRKESFFVAVDRDRKCLLYAKARIREEQVGNVELVCCDVRYLPFKSGSVDVSFNIGGVEHLRDSCVKTFLDEVKRVTRFKFIITFTGEKFRRKLHYRLGLVHLRFLLSRSSVPKLYSKVEVEKLLNDAFKEVAVYEVGEYNIVAQAST
ncbi:MAG: class I SAM-dependent methyltransferase [Candidatus Bathyarchaeales archaeon]